MRSVILPLRGKRHPELGRLRLVVTRAGETDAMTLKPECAAPTEALKSELAATLRAVTKLGGNIELIGAGSLPNDGKVIAGPALAQCSCDHGPTREPGRLPSIPTEKDSSNCFYMLIGFVLQHLLKFFQLKIEILPIALLGYLTDGSVRRACRGRIAGTGRA